MTVEPLYDRCDAIRRQLLGAATRNNGRYVPSEDDVPLRGWLHETSVTILPLRWDPGTLNSVTS